MEPQLEPLAAIYRAHRTPLRKKLVRHGVRYVDVDDVLHDLFSSLHRGLATGKARPQNLVRWVYAAAYNQAVDYIKRDRSQLERYTPLDTDALPPHDTALPPDAPDQLAVEERRRFLYDAIHRMPPEQRAVFEHRVLYGLTSEQTAEVLDLAETTVLARYKASLEFLETEYARWCARKSRNGALMVPLGLATLVKHESERLGAGTDEASDGGWPRFVAQAGAPREANYAVVPAPWRRKGSLVAIFIGGGIVGAAALWLFLYLTGSLVSPLELRTDETSWILRIKEPSASPAHQETLSRDNLHGAAAEQPTSPESSHRSGDRAASPNATTPSADGREASLPMTEQELLIAAQLAVGKGRFKRARSLLARHAREFPNGTLKGTRDSLLASLPQ